MTHSAIGFPTHDLEAMRVRLREGQLNALRGLLPDDAIWQACDSASYVYRKRLLTPLVVVLHYLTAALWPEDSFQAAAACGGVSVPSGSLSKARQRLPVAVMDRLEAYVSAVGQLLSMPYASHRGFRIVTIDGTCLSMEENPELVAEFGRVNTKHGRSKYPEARLVAASLARVGTILAHKLGAYRTSEQALGLEVLESLKRGDLLVADAHFAGSNLYWSYMQQGLEFVTPIHQRLKLDRLRRIREYSDGSFVAAVSIWESQRKKYPFLPEEMTLRFVPVELKTRRGVVQTYLVTSLLDADAYPADLVREFYSMRWPIETVFYELKLPLSADVLRSRTVEGIYKEVAAKVTALNLVRCLMLQAAQRHTCDPSRLSFVHSVRVAVSCSLKMSTAPVWMLCDLFEEMLREITLVTNPSRPGRVEPRAVRREFKHFQRLKTTRSQWRATHGISA
jgi:hypothetical protein